MESDAIVIPYRCRPFDNSINVIRSIIPPPPFRGDYRIELPNDMNRTDLPNAPRRLIGRERGRHALGERLPGLPRPQPIWIRERPLQPVARRRVGQVVQLGTRASG